MPDRASGALSEFLFRGLMFEAGAHELAKSGIQVGSNDQIRQEDALLHESLGAFPLVMRAEALEMARLYAVLYCFENSVRQLIDETLAERVGANWWASAVPLGVRKQAESRQKDAEENPWLQGRADSLLGFVDFGGLEKVISNNWENFQDLIPSQAWLKQRLDELERIRNFIAHNRKLTAEEFARVYMYVRDWNQAVSL